MTSGMFMLLFNSPFADEAAFSPECDDLKRDMKALELFLLDQDDHKNNCPKLKWIQPDISVYKKELKSQLPESCKK
tara:strand:- start:3776 stop:4003 length:228 start_codon:yes stop_codon:yes gene_type:complete